MFVCALASRFAKAIFTIASPFHEYWTLSSYLDFDEEVDYGSATSVHEDEGTLINSPLTEERPFTAPIPFVERAETIAPVAQHHATDAGEHII